MAPMDSKPSQMVSNRSKTSPTHAFGNMLASEITQPTPAKFPETLILVILAQKGPKWSKTEISQMAPMDLKPSQMVSNRSKTTPTLKFGNSLAWEITQPTPAKRPKILILAILAPKGPKWPKTEISQMAPMDSKPSQMVSNRSKTSLAQTIGYI